MSNSFKVSNSRVKTWRRCHYAYHLKYVENLRKKAKSRPLTFGTLVHQMIEEHANDGNPFEVLDRIDPQSMKLFDVEKETYGNLIADIRCIMTDYFQYWGEENELDYVRLNKRNAEHEFELDMGNGMLVTGKIDAFARTRNRLTWLVEHKTFTNMPNEDQHWRNVQSILYTRISELLGWPRVEGTLWDYIRSKPPATPKLLKNGGWSKRPMDTLPSRLREFATEKKIKVPALAIESAEKNQARYFQRVFTPTKSGLVDRVFGDFLETAREMRDNHGRSKAKTIDRHCDWCEFEPICRAELRGGDPDFVKEKDFYVEEKERSLTTDRAQAADATRVGDTSKLEHGRLRSKRHRQNNVRRHRT